MFAAVVGIKSGVVRSCIRNFSLAEGIDVGDTLIDREFVDRAVVDGMHRLHLAGVFGKIDLNMVHELFLTFLL